MLKESLLAAAMAFPAWHGDKESAEDREARLTVIAQAIDEAVAIATCRSAGKAPERSASQASSDSKDDADSKTESDAESERQSCKRYWHGSPRELGFLLLGQAFFETRLALHVHAGQCRVEIGECDGGRAISLWQLQYGYHLPVERWRTLSGTDLESTREAALEASRALARGRNFCKGSLEGAVASYATGKSCRWKGAAKRVRFVRKMMSKY